MTKVIEIKTNLMDSYNTEFDELLYGTPSSKLVSNELTATYERSIKDVRNVETDTLIIPGVVCSDEESKVLSSVVVNGFFDSEDDYKCVLTDVSFTMQFTSCFTKVSSLFMDIRYDGLRDVMYVDGELGIYPNAYDVLSIARSIFEEKFYELRVPTEAKAKHRADFESYKEERLKARQAELARRDSIDEDGLPF